MGISVAGHALDKTDTVVSPVEVHKVINNLSQGDSILS